MKSKKENIQGKAKFLLLGLFLLSGVESFAIAQPGEYVSIHSTGAGNQDSTGATGVDAIAIGKDAKSERDKGVAIGKGARVKPLSPSEKEFGLNTPGVAIGADSVSDSFGGVAIGYEATTGIGGVALGREAKSSSAGISIGEKASGKGISIGEKASGDGVAIGYRALSKGKDGVVIGNKIPTGTVSEGATLVGNINHVNEKDGNKVLPEVLFGHITASNTKKGMYFGVHNIANSTEDLIIGAAEIDNRDELNSQGNPRGENTVVGRYQYLNNISNLIAMGHHQEINHTEGMISIANHSYSTKANHSILIGGNDRSKTPESTLFIHDSNYAISLGMVNLLDKSSDSIVISKNTNLKEAEGTVAIGADIGEVRSKGSVILGQNSKEAEATKEEKLTVDGKEYKFAGAIGEKDGTLLTGNYVSFGATGNERQLKHVASGKISEDSTDGINGSQLYAVKTSFEEKLKETRKTQGNTLNKNEVQKIAKDSLILENKDKSIVISSREENDVKTYELSLEKEIQEKINKVDTIAIHDKEQDKSIADNRHRIEHLKRDVNSVGALGSAMAALHPLQFDEKKPNQIMTGLGTYRDKQAVAVGMAHYFTGNFMMTAGIAMEGNKKTKAMANVGLTYKFGKEEERTHLPEERGGALSSIYKMQDEIQELRKENQMQKEQLGRQAKQLAAQQATLDKMIHQIEMLLKRK